MSSAPKRTASSLDKFVSLEKLLAEPEPAVPWVVEGRLQVGGFSLLVARPKAGKSTNARELCLNVARGEPWLGHDTTRGRVIYCGFEEKRSEVAKHFRRMGAFDDDLLVFTDMPGKGFMAEIEQAIDTHRPVLVVLDGLFRLIRVADASDYVQMSRALEPLLDLARRLNTHILATHHSPKSDESADGVLGSTAIFGTVDCLIRIRLGASGERTMTTVQRYGADLPGTVLHLDEATGRTSAVGLKSDQAIARLSSTLLEALSGGDVVQEGDLLDSVAGRRSLKYQALRLLREVGKVTRLGKGGKGDPFRYQIPFPVPGVGEGTGNAGREVPRDLGSSSQGSTDSAIDRNSESGQKRRTMDILRRPVPGSLPWHRNRK